MDMKKINKICAQMEKENQQSWEGDDLKIKIMPTDPVEIDVGVWGFRKALNAY